MFFMANGPVPLSFLLCTIPPVRHGVQYAMCVSFSHGRGRSEYVWVNRGLIIFRAVEARSSFVSRGGRPLPYGIAMARYPDGGQ